MDAIPPPGGIDEPIVVAADVEPLRVESATLAELTPEYALFTHGCWFTHGDLRIDPVGEYIATRGHDADNTGFRDFAEPLFAGIARGAADEVWDRRLLFTRRAGWPALRDFLAGVAAVDPATGRIFQATMQAVAVSDVVAGAGGGLVFVTCFGVNGSDCRLRFHSCPRPGGVARVERIDPSARTRRLAAIVRATGRTAMEGR